MRNIPLFHDYSTIALVEPLFVEKYDTLEYQNEEAREFSVVIHLLSCCGAVSKVSEYLVPTMG
jgi:hypothetical protein